MQLFNLFIAFFKTGIFSFGGGYSMISMLSNEAVKNKWMTYSEFFEIVSISQITPGPIAINMATFVGFRQARFLGAILATISISLPSLLIILILMRFISKFKNSLVTKNIFYALKPTVTGLIAAALFQIAWVQFFNNTLILDFKSAIKNVNYTSILFSISCFFLAYKFNINFITLIIVSCILGIIIF